MLDPAQVGAPDAEPRRARSAFPILWAFRRLEARRDGADGGATGPASAGRLRTKRRPEDTAGPDPAGPARTWRRVGNAGAHRREDMGHAGWPRHRGRRRTH